MIAIEESKTVVKRNIEEYDEEEANKVVFKEEKGGTCVWWSRKRFLGEKESGFRAADYGRNQHESQFGFHFPSGKVYGL